MSTTESQLSEEIKKNTIYRMDESLRMVEKSLGELKEEEIWRRPNEASNSIGNIMVHLCGNITQYVLAGIGGKKDMRQRDAEFNISGGISKEQLMADLKSLIEQVKELVESLTDEQLIKYYKVQGFNLSGVGILMHVVEHFSYHTGQIAYWVKCLKAKDLEFYSGIDLNTKNEN
ncbi:DinB family protein [Muriicola sp. E247]|uniref:DinB family protein n=1 Tax=Muriicola sp. E247 TaxID=3242730 RepID=UPI003524E12F